MPHRTEAEIRNRLEVLVDGWHRAAPADRVWLVVEKIRLEHELEELQGKEES